MHMYAQYTYTLTHTHTHTHIRTHTYTHAHAHAHTHTHTHMPMYEQKQFQETRYMWATGLHITGLQIKPLILYKSPLDEDKIWLIMISLFTFI